MRPVWLRVLLEGGVRERGMVLGRREGVLERVVWCAGGVCGCVRRVSVRGASEDVNLRKCACQRRVPLPWACECPIHRALWVSARAHLKAVLPTEGGIPIFSTMWQKDVPR